MNEIINDVTQNMTVENLKKNRPKCQNFGKTTERVRKSTYFK